MLVSVFTPTHKPEHLQELWECLQAQTHMDWEWVVVPNGERTTEIVDLLQKMSGYDKRLRIFTSEGSNIGALKRFACDHCTGELFVEVDHDDLIVPECLSTLVSHVGDEPAFVYSDAHTLNYDGSSRTFDKAYGWRHYQATVLGKEAMINETHPPHPRILCEILYTPDHVRAWTRSAYELAGGHDPDLAVGDDHDLVVRTYLAGVEFVQIKQPLYVHRLSADGASQVNINKISQQSFATRDTMLPALVQQWCKRTGLPMFDLGGAHGCPEEYIPIDPCLPDGVRGHKGDVFEVLEALLDSSVGCFRACDFLEHIPAVRVVELMNLLHRKLVAGGFVLSQTPATCDDEGRCGRGAYQDPTHISFWNSNSFWYYTSEFYRKFLNGKVTCRFQTVAVSNYYPSAFHRQHLIPYVMWYGMALKDDDQNYLPGLKHV